MQLSSCIEYEFFYGGPFSEKLQNWIVASCKIGMMLQKYNMKYNYSLHTTFNVDIFYKI